MKKVLVIGGGAAGIMAAYSAARSGQEVHIYEKNEKLGKKLFITGKGRCNITNASDMEVLFQNVVSNYKFLYSAFYTFTNEQMIELMKEAGVPVKIERGNRVFPVSDKSSDVIGGLERLLKKEGVAIHLKSEVSKILTSQQENDKTVMGIMLQDGSEVKGEQVIVATGGVSYPSTGSTGDGMSMTEKLGHTKTRLYPALVPIEIEEEWVSRLQGLSLRNVSVSFSAGKKEFYQNFGEMVFTHYGVSGPVILSGSSYLPKYEKKERVEVCVDLKPALSEKQLDLRILRDFEENKNKDFKNSLNLLLPRKIIPIIIELSGISPEKKIHEITKEERRQLIYIIKNLKMHVKGVRGFEEAIITQGGVKVKEINPATMESKLVKGLYFAGEIMDVDALTGGYNLQIAWSTGYLAGLSTARE